MKRALADLVTTICHARRESTGFVLSTKTTMRTVSVGSLSRIHGGGSGADLPKGTWSTAVLASSI
jgi:hypothetical protein